MLSPERFLITHIEERFEHKSGAFSYVLTLSQA